LLATAFMHLLPEAFESGLEPSVLFAVLLGGLVLFFLLDKAELWHHGHEHHHGPAADIHPGAAAHGHDHAGHGHNHAGHAHVHAPEGGAGHGHANGPRVGGWAVLAGDSVHCFGDGVLIASAFMADTRLGLLAALSVLAHEVPHHVGDLVVMRQTSPDARAALIKVSLAGTVTALGGVLGWWLVERLHGWLPYFLVLASSSFAYVALADLIPQLQRRLAARQTVLQVLWLLAGIVLVTGVSRLAHGDEHGHAHGPEIERPAGASAPQRH
jgi:zinc and cadmium transporter